MKKRVKKDNRNKGQTLIGIIIVLVIVALFSGGLYYYLSKQTPKIPQNTQESNEEAVKSPDATPSPEEEPTPSPEEEKPIVQKCSDGTLYNQCSTNKPFYCENGNLIDKCSICGCPANTVCQDGNCVVQQRCSDGTLYGQCSTNKPKYCDNGNLIDKCATCNCPSNQACQTDGSCKTAITCQNECSQIGLKGCSNNGYQTCGNYDTDECLEWSSITDCLQNTICQNGICIQQEQKCADETPYSQCSTNKPKYCENGNLIDKCLICGCSLNYYCDEFSGSCKVAEKLDMLIFISPQYAADTQIQQAINEYIDAVKNDVGWDTKTINITPEINDFIKIDKIIEDYYGKSGARLKGCVMVGEDIDTAVKAEAWGQEAPSIIPWATNDDYTMIRVPEEMVITDDIDKTSETLKGWKVVGGLKRVDVAISLLYPPHNLDYQTRAQLISSVFEKFSENRNKIYPKKTVIFVDPAIWKELPQTLLDLLDGHSETYHKEPPIQEEIEGTLNGEYMLYVVEGHGRPDEVETSPPPNRSDFYAKYLSSLNTPLFLAGGCYTEGWWTNDYSCSDYWCNGQLDYSINENWFGAKIFTNPYLRVEVLSDPFQGGAESPQRNFIGMAISDLMQNKTLAESLKGDLLWNIDSTIIYGDLTFHYNF